MSVKFTIDYKFEHIELEITPDGEMVILSHDMNYEVLASSLGEDSPALEFLIKWNKDPIAAICEYIGMEKNYIAKLSCDWAEHVLPIFERSRKKNFIPRNAIQIARDFLDGKIFAAQAQAELDSVSWAATNLSEAAWTKKFSAKAAAKSAEAAGAAARAVERAAANGGVSYAAIWTATAAAEAAENENEEISWQVRHFVHAMECVQAGKDWPDIKETP